MIIIIVGGLTPPIKKMAWKSICLEVGSVNRKEYALELYQKLQEEEVCVCISVLLTMKSVIVHCFRKDLVRN